VLAYIHRCRGEVFLCIPNLSRAVGAVDLELPAFRGAIPREALSQTLFPPIGSYPYFLTLGPYEFQWHSLVDDIKRISCFISYSSRDDALAKKLLEELEHMSIECCKAPGDLTIGRELRGTHDPDRAQIRSPGRTPFAGFDPQRMGEILGRDCASTGACRVPPTPAGPPASSR
jgi:hypothetical protein